MKRERKHFRNPGIERNLSKATSELEGQMEGASLYCTIPCWIQCLHAHTVYQYILYPMIVHEGPDIFKKKVLLLVVAMQYMLRLSCTHSYSYKTHGVLGDRYYWHDILLTYKLDLFEDTVYTMSLKTSKMIKDIDGVSLVLFWGVVFQMSLAFTA